MLSFFDRLIALYQEYAALHLFIWGSSNVFGYFFVCCTGLKALAARQHLRHVDGYARKFIDATTFSVPASFILCVTHAEYMISGFSKISLESNGAFFMGHAATIVAATYLHLGVMDMPKRS